MDAGINIGDTLTTRAYLNPNKQALYDLTAGQRYTFTELNARANQNCAAVQGLELGKGDRVALLAYNGHEFALDYDLPAGEAGEILVRGPHNMKEYWNRPEATAAAIVDGWLHTGDIAVMDKEGFVTIQDRIKDMIISGGENVYPAEIESVLLHHPAIADAAVIGQDSEKWGESPLAIIVKKEDRLTEVEVLEHCSSKLARFKLPKGAVFVEEIPRNPSGKILKRVLRDLFPGPAPE